jgi:hypothetical protein
VQEKNNKCDLSYGDRGAVSIRIQMTGFSARSEKYGSTKKCDSDRLVNTGLCALYDEECVLLTNDSD